MPKLRVGMGHVIIPPARYNGGMKERDDLPADIFDEDTALRILRVDEQWRYVLLMAKQHGSHPDSRSDYVTDGFALNYVLRGQGVYREEGGRSHALTPGAAFQRLPGRRHSTILDPASDYAELFLILDPATARQLIGLGLILETEVLPVGASVGVVEEFRALRRSLEQPEVELPTRAALTLVIRFLNNLYGLANRVEAGDSWGHRIRRACALLERDLDQRLDMADVAEKLGVTYPTFRRRFREAMQVSPGAYRICRRLEQARFRLLENSVKQVAEDLGYSDPFTFSAQFKAHFGVSPQRFQARQGESLPE